jgi:hypothetical protein
MVFFRGFYFREHAGDTTMILLVDNYDSFTYNLAQYLGELGCDVQVHRNDKISTANRNASSSLPARAPRRKRASP